MNIADRITLLDLVLMGGRVELIKGQVYRTVVLPDEQAAASLVERFTPELDPERMTISRDGNRVDLVIDVDPEIYRLFTY